MLPRDYNVYYLSDISLKCVRGCISSNDAPILYSSDWDSDGVISRESPVIRFGPAMMFAEDLTRGFFGEVAVIIRKHCGRRGLQSFQKELNLVGRIIG